MLLDREGPRSRQPNGVEPGLADARRQVPLNVSQLLGEAGEGPVTLGWQRRDCQTGERSDELSERCVARAGLFSSLSVEPENRVPAAVCGQIPGEYEEPVGRLVRLIAKSEDPDLRMEDMARSRSLHSMDYVLKQREQIGRPSPVADGAGLAEDIEPSAHLAQRFHDLDGVRLVLEPEPRERERHHQRRLEIERERRGDSAIQRTASWRPQRVEQEGAAVRREHGRAPDRRRCLRASA